MTFILNEERALKLHLSDLKVSDGKEPLRSVGVWFNQPDVEIRPSTYPFITISMVDVVEALERTHRGRIVLPYTPENPPATIPGTSNVVDYPIPYDLIYQVVTYARHPLHDRQLIQQLLMYKLGSRIHTLFIPEDNTVRTMFMTGSRKSDTTTDGRRLFRNAYTLKISSELLPSQIEQIQQVTSVKTTFESYQ